MKYAPGGTGSLPPRRRGTAQAYRYADFGSAFSDQCGSGGSARVGTAYLTTKDGKSNILEHVEDALEAQRRMEAIPEIKGVYFSALDALDGLTGPALTAGIEALAQANADRNWG